MNMMAKSQVKTCQNMNLTDRVARGALGIVLVAISPMGTELLAGGAIGWFCFAFGMANIISSIFGWCFMYSLVGLTSLESIDKDDGKKLIKLDYNSLRKKSVLGFGTIALMISALYLSEGYQSSKLTVQRMELDQLHDIAILISDELKDEFIKIGEGTLESYTSLSEKEILSAMYHFDKPLAVIVYSQGVFKIVQKNLSESTKIEILNRFSNGIKPLLSENYHTKEETHLFKFKNQIEKYFLTINDQQFGWTFHPLEKGLERESDWVVVVKESESSEHVFKEVFSRLLISSIVVIWLALWGAVAVAYFIWKHVESSNRRALKAAKTDPETGLMNELALRSYFEEISSNRDRTRYQVCAAQFRNLPQILASNSPAIVSRILHQLACRLTQSTSGRCTLGKLNDGSFIIIAPRSDETCFNNFRTIINETQLVDEFQFSLEPTEVVVQYPEDVDTFEDLVSALSAISFSAIKSRIPIVHYDESLIKKSDKTTQYAAEIRSAIEKGQFELYLQPKVNPATATVVGAEALIRWNHPQDGLLSPFHFLDIVERSNVRSCFAKFVIQEAARLAKEIKNKGFDIPVSFNLNAYDIMDIDVQKTLKSVAHSMHLESSRLLEVELTESETTVNVSHIAECLEKISNLGFDIALDDFGTGMSSLSFVHKLPINTIKVDKSFIGLLDGDKKSHLPIMSIQFLAHSYGYKVVAEGVEKAEHVEILKAMNYPILQGYYYSKPMRKADFMAFISR